MTPRRAGSGRFGKILTSLDGSASVRRRRSIALFLARATDIGQNIAVGYAREIRFSRYFSGISSKMRRGECPEISDVGKLAWDSGWPAHGMTNALMKRPVSEG